VITPSCPEEEWNVLLMYCGQSPVVAADADGTAEAPTTTVAAAASSAALPRTRIPLSALPDFDDVRRE
jgi:hypothetical protein